MATKKTLFLKDLLSENENFELFFHSGHSAQGNQSMTLSDYSANAFLPAGSQTRKFTQDTPSHHIVWEGIEFVFYPIKGAHDFPSSSSYAIIPKTHIDEAFIPSDLNKVIYIECPKPIDDPRAVITAIFKADGSELDITALKYFEGDFVQMPKEDLLVAFIPTAAPRHIGRKDNCLIAELDFATKQISIFDSPGGIAKKPVTVKGLGDITYYTCADLFKTCVYTGPAPFTYKELCNNAAPAKRHVKKLYDYVHNDIGPRLPFPIMHNDHFNRHYIHEIRGTKESFDNWINAYITFFANSSAHRLADPDFSPHYHFPRGYNPAILSNAISSYCASLPELGYSYSYGETEPGHRLKRNLEWLVRITGHMFDLYLIEFSKSSEHVVPRGSRGFARRPSSRTITYEGINPSTINATDRINAYRYLKRAIELTPHLNDLDKTLTLSILKDCAENILPPAWNGELS